MKIEKKIEKERKGAWRKKERKEKKSEISQKSQKSEKSQNKNHKNHIVSNRYIKSLRSFLLEINMFMLSFLLLSLFSSCLASCPFVHDSTTSDSCDTKEVVTEMLETVRISDSGLIFPGTTELEPTAQGCVCRTTCKASVTTGLADCDWCYTQGKCGTFSLHGYWDFCKFPKQSQYEAQSASNKLSALWEKVIESRSHGSYPFIGDAALESVQTSFDVIRDVMPAGRLKVIHSVGAVCQFEMKINPDSPYSGVFAPNAAATGLIRLGGALPPSASSGMIPGFGVKFLRDGVPSGNFVALVGLSSLPHNSGNFFQANFSNAIPPPSGVTAVLATKFKQASNCITQVGLSDICSFGLDGSKVVNVVFPYRLKLFSSNVQFPTNSVDTNGLLDQLRSIPPGTILFDVYAFATPQDFKDDKGILLGEIVTTSECTSSRFGDNSLFFSHVRIEDDWKLRPDFIPSSHDAPNLCGSSHVNPNPPAYCKSH